MLGGVGNEYIWKNCIQYCIIILYLIYKKNPVVKLYIIYTTKSKTGQNILGLSKTLDDLSLKECFSVGGTRYMLTHAHIGNRSRVIDNLCLSEVGIFGFFNRENAGLRKYIPFYGREVNFFN